MVATLHKDSSKQPTKGRGTTSNIHAFWQKNAKQFQMLQDASWSDLLVKREIAVLLTHLKDGDRVLDVGCASGFSSLHFVQERNIALTGIDYVSEMVQHAEAARALLPKTVRRRATFLKGNVLKLELPKNSFDVVISTRCLCNLTTWREQEKALQEIWKVLRPGGLLLLSEPTTVGLAQLNKIGAIFRLKPLVSPWHNLYLNEAALFNFAPDYYTIQVDYFSSTYYLLSRILYRWLCADDASKLRRNSLLNILGIHLPSIGKWGVQRLYIMQKRNDENTG